MIEPSLINCVIYHKDCSDGFGAAYSAWKLLGNKAEYIACSHGEPPPDVSGKRVAILDFSFDNKTTKEMIESAEALVVIDHHKSAMIELHDINCTIFDMSKSGASMAWDFFHPAKETPKFIQYIEDRDLWKWEMPYSKEFAAAFDMVPWDFSAFEEFEDDSVIDDAIKRGSYILAYSKTVVKKICDKATRKEMEINGKKYDVMVVNSSHWMSEIGSTLSKDCDVAMIYYFNHDEKVYKVSLRAFHEHIDVSEISKHFGGGGHKKAAGFNLPFNIHPETLFLEDLEKTDPSIKKDVSLNENYYGAD